MNGRRVPGEVTDNESTRPTHGLYEVNTKVSMNVTLIDLPAFINCVLEIPETDYVQERSQTFNGEIRFLCERSFWLMLTFPVLLFSANRLGSEWP